MKSKNEPHLSIVIVHYNSISHLQKLLSMLSKDAQLQIIVVDNFSTTQVTKKVKEVVERHQENHNVLLVTNHDNPGFAAGCNEGAGFAKGEWVLFLNPDIEVEPEKIHYMVEQATERKLDAASPRPKTTDYLKPVPTPLSLLAEFTPLKMLVPLSYFKRRTLTGGFLLIKQSVLKQLGGWDERFFLWFEDSDLSKRLYDEGFKIGWIDLPHIHVGGGSLKKLDANNQRYLFFTSMMQYANKHFGPGGVVVVKLLQKKYMPAKQ